MRIQTLLLGLGVATLLLGAATVDQKAEARSQADRLFARATPDDFLGDEACASCHVQQAAEFNHSAHAPFMAGDKLPLDKKGCEGCHGPGGIHQADENAEVIAFRKMTPKESAAACLRCHQSTLSESHWKRSAHAKADLSCVTCHQIHPSSEPEWEHGAVRKGQAGDAKKPVFVARVEPKAMLKADEATLCGQCHGRELVQFKLNSHHPIPEGKMACSDCHSVHPSRDARVKGGDEKDKCVTCHTEFAGPFVFEHDPVAGHTGDGCNECHKPHGSTNPKMLNSFSRGLCAQCHTEKLSTHFPGQTCWTAGCHVATHGSNTSRNFLEP